MKDRKTYQIVLFVAGCILLNIIGKCITSLLPLPLWLDSFGTILSAYVLGPFCGAVVGVVVNIVNGFSDYRTYAYAAVSIALGVVTGYLARKRLFENLFGILSAAFLVAIMSTALSMPFNCIFYDGDIGNVWGDGVIALLQRYGVKPLLSIAIGQFYLEFPDKVMMYSLLYALIHGWRRHGKPMEKKPGKTGALALAAVISAGLLSGLLPSAETAYAADTSKYDKYMQTVYNAENGLPGGTANDITATKDGILWIGTYGGLYRYNGQRFVWMNDIESVKNVNCFYTDDEGRLWVGTNDNGFTILINGEVSNVINEDDGLPANSVRCITKGAGTSYYVGTTDSLAVVNMSGGIAVTDVVSEVKYANSISVNDEGSAAIVTDAGYLCLVNRSRVISKRDGDGAGYTCCAFDKNGNLLAGRTDNQIDIYTADGVLHKTGAIDCGGISYIKSINCSEDGNVIVCADNGAGYIDSAFAFHEINTGEYDNSIEHSIIDYQGNLWFASTRLGLLKLSESSFTDAFPDAGISERVINAVMRYGANMYFGADNGLVIVNTETEECVENELTALLTDVRVRSIIRDSADNLWISTSGKGLIKAEPDGGIAVYDSSSGGLGNKLRSTLELSGGGILVAGDSGLSCLENGRETFVLGSGDGLANPKILCLNETEDGSVLAGSDGGGIYVVKDGQVQRTISRADGLASDIVLKIISDSDGGRFIVTGSGLCYMDADYNVRTLENFPYYNNYDVIPIGDTLFVTGSAGIYVVNRKALLDGSDLNDAVLLDAKVGLHGSFTANSWSYLDDDGELYLPCSRGAAKININDYNSSRRSYRLQLRKTIYDGVSYVVEAGETVTIPSGAEEIVLCPEFINYMSNDPYVSVYLEGYDAEPRTMLLSELSDVTYSNLPAGSYSFKMEVIDENKRNAASVSYEVVKEKEIYDHGWFVFYVCVVGLAAIFYFSWMLFRTQLQRTLSVQRRELELARRHVEMGNEAILTIAQTLDARDANTGQHAKRVSEYAVLIAKEMGFTPAECEELRKTALLHDIGKIGIPDRILNKPGRLTDEEYEIMKSHVTRGAEILKNFTFAGNVVDGALYHHERYDGKGYVHGLKGEEIPLNARIIGMADMFDAMTANRVYRKKLDFDYVISEIERGIGTQFDPEVARVLLKLIDDGVINREELYGEATDDESGNKDEAGDDE